MPNWCYTNYVVEGPKEQIQRLYDTMICVSSMPKPGLIQNDFGANWLGNLVKAIGGDPFQSKGFRCRGQFYDAVIESDGTLVFGAETAWCEADDTRHLIEEKFPGVFIYFMAEEFGNGYWETNDVDGKYFPERYFLEVFDDNNPESSLYHSTLAGLIADVENITGVKGLKTFQDCDHALYEFDPEDGYSIHHVTFSHD